jgi:hypothetical protein
MQAIRTLAVAAGLLAFAASPPPAVAAPAAAPACPTVFASLDATIDTRTAHAGDPFRFTTLTPVSAGSVALPAFAHGVGVVMSYTHAKGGGQPGYLILEARYLVAPDGAHVPATLVPGGDGHAQAFVRGGTSSSGFLTAIPYYVGTAASIYDALHHGKEAALLAGSRMLLVVGDEFFAGACRLNVDQS